MIDRIYHMSDSDHGNKQYTWAYTISPSLHSISVLCDSCGVGRLFPDRYPRVPLGVIVEGGTRYPDVLGCGAYPLLFVSAAVVRDWEQNDIRGYKAYPLGVVEAKGGRIRSVVPPSYFHIEITGRCEMDLDAMGCILLSQCPNCGHAEVEPAWGHPVIIKATDGSDLFVSDLFPCVSFCADKVMVLTARQGRTNFQFKRPEDYWEPESIVLST